MNVLSRKMMVTVAVALSLVVVSAAPASADSAEFVAVGTLTIKFDPDLVVPIGEDPPHPCRDPEEYFTATTSGDAATGDVDVSLPSLFVPKPGVTPVAYDEVRFSSVFDTLVYDRVVPSPPGGHDYDYDITGVVALILDVYNIEQGEFPCDKTAFKCSFGLVLDVAGSRLHNHAPATFLPVFAAGATVDHLEATTVGQTPLTYLSGDCDEYLSLGERDVNLDLLLTRFP